MVISIFLAFAVCDDPHSLYVQQLRACPAAFYWLLAELKRWTLFRQSFLRQSNSLVTLSKKTMNIFPVRLFYSCKLDKLLKKNYCFLSSTWREAMPPDLTQRLFYKVKANHCLTLSVKKSFSRRDSQVGPRGFVISTQLQRPSGVVIAIR